MQQHDKANAYYAHGLWVWKMMDTLGWKENNRIGIHTETWNDMIRCQEEGIYPQSFTIIRCPVIMLHGKMIRDKLKQYIPQLEYHEFEKCGHSPSKEKYVKDDFFQVMCAWLKKGFNKISI